MACRVVVSHRGVPPRFIAWSVPPGHEPTGPLAARLMHHLQVGQRATFAHRHAPRCQLPRMTSVRHLTALGMARALLAGPCDAAGLAARLRACLGESAPWMDRLAEHVAASPARRAWAWLLPADLAQRIEADPAYQDAWSEIASPRVRRYILRPVGGMRPRPLGLDTLALPALTHVGALAQWLDQTPQALWRLCKPSAWQRRDALGHQHYRHHFVPKARGGWRLIEAPEPYLQALQRRVLDGLLSQVPVHEAAHGFVPGRSVITHASLHTGREAILKFDLADFFGSVRASRVQALWSTLGYPLPVARCLTRLCTTATPEPVLGRWRQDGGATWEQAQRLRDAHLPQGAPTSPALANLCAFQLDLRLDGLAHRLGARYSRYADDIVLSGDGSLLRHAARIEAWVAALARDEGFVVNHRKTRRLPSHQRQQVTGVVVNARPNLQRDEFDRLKAELHQCAVHGPSSQNREGHVDYRQHLMGRVAWVRQLNPAKARRLQSWLERIDWAR